MTAINTLVNNGLPVGIAQKSIQPGTVLEVKWRDSANENVMVIDRESYRSTYKGLISFRVICKRGITCSIESDQVVAVKPQAPLALLGG